MPQARRPRVTEITGQALLDLEGLDAMAMMPRCDKTGANADLHLVVYEDPDTGERTAGVLGPEYRHLVRRTTTLSIPVGILSVGAIRSLEAHGKIPEGSSAAARLAAWLRHGLCETWGEVAEAKRAHQGALDLDDVAGLGI